MAEGIRMDVEDARMKLKRAGVKLRPLTLSKLIAQQWLFMIEQGFRKQGLEKSWQKLAPATVKGRRKRGVGAKILQDTGTLRQSFSPGAQGSLYDVREDRAQVGTQTEYAGFHEFGTSHIPDRPMLPSRRLALAEAEKVANALFEKVSEREGLS